MAQDGPIMLQSVKKIYIIILTLVFIQLEKAAVFPALNFMNEWSMLMLKNLFKLSQTVRDLYIIWSNNWDNLICLSRKMRQPL